MRYLLIFFILLANWMIWSGMFDVFHLSLGVISCGIVTFLSHDLLFSQKDMQGLPGRVWRLMKYLPWLLYQIVLSNLHVAYMVLHPKMPIDPQLVRFKSRLTSDEALATFANSITLTPGTITADIVDGEYYVHALSKKTADDLMTGDMEARVARIFMEE